MNPPEQYKDMDNMPLRWGHIKLFLIASSGQALGSGLATLIGIVLPMIQMISSPHLSSVEQGFLSSMSLLGIVVGSFFLGGLSDKYGCLKLFRICPFIIFLASLLAFFFDTTYVFAISLFIMGICIGGEYSIGSDYISETMPHRWKLFMVGAAKSTSALGSIAVAGVSYIFLTHTTDPSDWRYLLLLVSLMSALMFISRIKFAQSPGWLLAKGKVDEARASVKYFLGNDVGINVDEVSQKEDTQQSGMKSILSKRNMKKIIFSSIPWACEGFGVYGIGIFLPVLLIALGVDARHEDSFQRIVSSVQLTSVINIFVLIGFIVGLLLVNKIYHVKSQALGFVFCSLGLVILLVGYKLGLPLWFSILGFLVFEFFLNAGPHLMTFIIPPQIYSVAERGAGVGLSASIGKIGAVMSVFFIPNLLAWGGIQLVLVVAIIVNLLGAGVTLFYGEEVLPREQNSQVRNHLSIFKKIKWRSF